MLQAFVIFYIVAFVDLLGDGFIDANALFFFTDNFHLGDTAAAATQAGVAFMASLAMILGERLIDRTPTRTMAMLTKFVGVVALISVLALSTPVAERLASNYARFVAALGILLLLYGPAEGLGATVFTFTLMRTPVTDNDERDRHFGVLYAVSNAAQFAVFLGTLGWRKLAGGEGSGARAANWMSMASGVMGFLVTSVWLLVSFCGGDKCWPPSAADGRAHDQQQERRRRGGEGISFGRYLLAVVVFYGNRFAFAAVNAMLAKYLMRRYEETTNFPLYMSINPLLVMLLSLLMTRVRPLFSSHMTPRGWLVLGTLVQTLAFGWLLVAAAHAWSVVAFMVQFTIGEALGAPLLDPYLLGEVKLERQARYIALARPVSMAAHMLMGLATGALLELECPIGSLATACSARLWLWVMLTAGVTPVLLMGLRRLLPSSSSDSQ